MGNVRKRGGKGIGKGVIDRKGGRGIGKKEFREGEVSRQERRNG